MTTQRRHITVDPRDNVTTLIDDRSQLPAIVGEVELSEAVPFGHKVALCAIAQGAAIIKYGVPIGHALAPIAAGEHVHVHNCA